jgi:FKBP-type peptidyl-prolyl cis-trans isomerase (trigger factor)
MKAFYMFGLMAAVLLVSGCIGDYSETQDQMHEGTEEYAERLSQEMRNNGGEDMVVKSGDTVKVDYWLTVDGEQIDTSEGRGPFEFTVGSGQVIPGFDKAALGMAVGETKEVILEGEDAYTAGQLAGKVLNFKITILEIKS